jgi:uncharacterized repeat protein (TIGR04138 family)
MHHPKLDELVRRDPRYAYEAYEFIFAALAHAQKLLGLDVNPAQVQEEHHITGPQLLEGVRDLALREFGLMARTVFRMWGVNRTDDFGEIVFNLVEAGLMSKTPNDDRQHFHEIYDLDEVLERRYRIEVPQEADDL